MTKVPLRGQKSVRNQSETGQTQPLSLSLAYSLTLLPELLRLLLFQFPLPLLLLLLLVLLVLLWVFQTGFRTAQAYFAPKFEIECVHAWILTLITRPSTTLSTTTTPPATAPPLPLVHLGISAFAFKSNWHESRWRVRSQSETSQKPVRNRPNATICSPLSLSLSFSLSPSPFLPLPCY